MRDQESTEFPEIDTAPEPKKNCRSLQKKLIIFYFVFIGLIFFNSSDWFAAIIVFPSWIWCLLGLILTVRIPLRKWAGNLKLAAICSLVVLLMTSEELYSVLRGISLNKNYDPPWMTSLNCAGGSIEAAKEAVDTDAEIIFLQESPSKRELEELCKIHGYQLFWGIDASILLKPKYHVQSIKQEQNYTLVRTNQQIFVSLRLQPPIFRLDYWNLDCWNSQMQTMRSRKSELLEILHHIFYKEVEDFANERSVTGVKENLTPMIFIGGDFNAPHSQLKAQSFGWDLRDLGDTMSVGWCGTAINEFPLVRIDRVWTSGININNSTVLSTKTANSDHRMVVVYR